MRDIPPAGDVGRRKFRRRRAGDAPPLTPPRTAPLPVPPAAPPRAPDRARGSRGPRPGRARPGRSGSARRRGRGAAPPRCRSAPTFTLSGLASACITPTASRVSSIRRAESSGDRSVSSRRRGGAAPGRARGSACRRAAARSTGRGRERDGVGGQPGSREKSVIGSRQCASAPAWRRGRGCGWWRRRRSSGAGGSGVGALDEEVRSRSPRPR